MTIVTVGLLLLVLLLLWTPCALQSECFDSNCDADFDELSASPKADVALPGSASFAASLAKGVPASTAPPPSDEDFPENFFFTLDMHWLMLNDPVRTRAFEAAIKEVVNENSIVIDLGTKQANNASYCR